MGQFPGFTSPGWKHFEPISLQRNAIMNTKIKPNTVLTARSLCDYDCIFEVQVLARSGSFVQVKAMGEEKRCKIKTMPDGEEFIMAHGRYSMAPAFRASTAKPLEEPQNRVAYPFIARAIRKHLSRDQMEDFVRLGGSAGFPGFSMSRDCEAFFREHQEGCLALLEDLARETKVELLDFIQRIQPLPVSQTEIARAIWQDKGECKASILDSIVWKVVETVCGQILGEK